MPPNTITPTQLVRKVAPKKLPPVRKWMAGPVMAGPVRKIKYNSSLVRIISSSVPSSNIVQRIVQRSSAVPANIDAKLRKLPSFSIRHLSLTSQNQKGLSPDSEDPQPKAPEEHDSQAVPAVLTVEQYNALSDEYMDTLVERLEQLQEEREDIDVEYSAGVLTLNFPPIGTYVINKQPPNKQIWLSSPLSGPKRYDYVILNEGQNSKEGTGLGQWIYLRDKSSLQDLLHSEVGVDLSIEKMTPTPPDIDE